MAEGYLQRLQADSSAAAEIVQALLPPTGRLVLVIDRLEEVFTLARIPMSGKPSWTRAWLWPGTPIVWSGW